MIKPKSVNLISPFGRKILENHPDFKTTQHAKNENWFIATDGEGDDVIQEEVYWKDNVAIVSTVDVSLNEYYLKRCYTVATTIKEILYVDFRISEKQKEKSRCLCILEKESLNIFTDVGELFVAAIPFKVKKIWALSNGVCVEREATSMDAEDDKKTIPILFSLTHPLEDFKPVVYRYQDSKKPMYFTDSSQHVVYTDRKFSLVFTYDSMLGLHSVWNARKAEEKDYPDIPSQHDSLPEFFNFANNSANTGKDPRSSPAHNKRHSCPPIPFQRKFSPVRNSSPQTKVHSPALPPAHHRGSPYHNHQGHDSIHLAADYSNHLKSRLSSPMILRMSCDESMIEEELEPLPPDVCLEQIWQEHGNFIKHGMKGKSDSAFTMKDFAGCVHLGYYIKCASKFRLFKMITKENRAHFEKVLELDCLGVGTVKDQNLIVIFDMSQNIQLYSGKQKVASVDLQTILNIEDVTKQRMSLLNFTSLSFDVVLTDDALSYRVELSSSVQCDLVTTMITALKDSLPNNEYNLSYAKYLCMFYDDTLLSNGNEWDRFVSATLKLFGFPEASAKSLKGNMDSPAPPVPKKAKKSESLIGVEDWEYLLASHNIEVDEVKEKEDKNTIKSKKKEKFLIEISLQKHAPLYKHIVKIFLLWHQLYEEMKLNLVEKENLLNVASLLHYFACVLQSKCHRKVYEQDFIQLKKKNENNVYKIVEESAILTDELSQIKNINEISLFESLLQGLTSSKVYPSFKSQYKYSIVLSKVYNMIYHHCSQNKNKTPEQMIRDMKLNKRNSDDLMGKLIGLMINEGFTTEDLNVIPFGYKLPILSILYNCKESNHEDMSIDTAMFLGREDIVSMKTPHSVNTTDRLFEQEKDDKSGMNFDYEILSFRFNQDLRIKEVKRLLNTSEPVTISLVQKPDVSDHNFAKEEEARLVVISKRTMAIPVARGMFTLATSQPVASETLSIPNLELTGRSTANNKTVSMQSETPNTKLYWPQFHNGVAAGLKISPSSTQIDSTWILFNRLKTTNLTPEHSGFLLALGLTGHLKVLPKLHLHDYLIKGHELTTVALLVGIASTQIGRKDSSIYKLLCLHLDSLLPPTALELNIPPMAQVAAIMAIGLLFYNTADLHLVKVLLYEIGRSPSADNDMPFCQESHALTSGFALGMIMIGKGKESTTVGDINVGDMLYHYIFGGQKKEVFANKLQKKESQSSQIEEGEIVNTNVTSPAGIIALSLMFLKTNNKTIGSWLHTPQSSENIMANIQPAHLLLRLLGYNLVMWDDLVPTKEWLHTYVPEKSEDSSLELHYRICAVTGCFLALALKFAGSANNAAFGLMFPYIAELKNLIKSPQIEELGAKTILEQCLNSILLAVSLLMAGTGNIQVLRVARSLHKRCSNEITYGNHMAVHMAIGFLFLGGGRYSLKTDNLSIATLLCAVYPKWPASSKDNRFHLQAFRHLYVLACEPRLFITRDVDTKKICYAPIKVRLKETQYYPEYEQKFLAPCLIPELNQIKKIEIIGPRYLPMTFSVDQNYSIEAVQNVFVKKKAAYLSYAEDPKGKTNLMARTFTNQTEKSEMIKSFNSSPEICLFEKIFCSMENSVNNKKDSLFYINTLHHCVTKEKLHVLKDLIEIEQCLKNIEGRNHTTSQVEQLVFLILFYEKIGFEKLYLENTANLLSKIDIMKIRMRLVRVYNHSEKGTSLNMKGLHLIGMLLS